MKPTRLMIALKILWRVPTTLWVYILSTTSKLFRCGGLHRVAPPRGSTGELDWGARFGSLRCTNSTGLPGGLMQHFRFCLAAFNGKICGAAAAVGFIIRRPQTSLAAARPTLRATTGAVSRENCCHAKTPTHHATLTGPLRC